MGVNKKSKSVIKKKSLVKKQTSFSSESNSKSDINDGSKLKSKPFNLMLKKNPNKKIDIESIESQLTNLENMETTKKIKKKIRQLEYLKKRYIQIQNTEKSLQSDTPSGDNVIQNESSEDTEVESESEICETNTKSNIKTESMKGIKRFVVFVGNLPKNTTEEDTTFHKVGKIKSIRIPDVKENRKSGFGFIELEDNISFEKTLSMNHTMLNNKRINVLYTNPDGKNLDKKEIKKKNAKFNVMRKAGLLAGSIPEHKKRSFRRKKKRLAEEKLAAMKKN